MAATMDKAARKRRLVKAAKTVKANIGISWAEWARRNGFSPFAVGQVVRGQRPAFTGQSHTIAETLFEEEKKILRGTKRPTAHYLDLSALGRSDRELVKSLVARLRRDA